MMFPPSPLSPTHECKPVSPCPDWIEAGPDVPIAKAIADLLLIAEGGDPGEWEGQVLYLPLP